MLLDKFLVITGTKRGYNLSLRARLVEREPKLNQNEIGLRLQIEIPKALFERPIITANMKIPDEAVPKSKLTPEITDNIEKIIRESTGLNMIVKIVEHKEEDNSQQS